MDEDDLLILIEEKELEIDVLRSEFSEFQSESKEKIQLGNKLPASPSAFLF